MRKIFGVIAFSGSHIKLQANQTVSLTFASPTFQAHNELTCAGVLWSVAPNLVLFLFAYTAIGTWITTSAFGRRLMHLTYTVLRQEGDLRFSLVRTRENSGALHFSGRMGRKYECV